MLVWNKQRKFHLLFFNEKYIIERVKQVYM